MSIEMYGCVIADSSFYCCYESDIKKREFLFSYFQKYKFFIGKKIKGELPVSLSEDKEFLRSVVVVEENFFELVRPFFNRSDRHENDGEYEAIGIGYYLDENFNLKHLIIDDIIAYKFTIKHFPSLSRKLTRTIGFVKKGCYEDKTISPTFAIEILELMKQIFDNGIKERSYKKRPCSVDQKVCDKILIPLIAQIKSDYKYGKI